MAMPDTTSREVPGFWRRGSVRRIVLGLVAVHAVIASGAPGYVLLRWSPGGALFMVGVTISTVGYGEVQPVSGAARALTMVVIFLGSIAVTFTLAGFVQFLAEGEIRQLLGRQRMRRQIETLSGHTIIAGFGRVGTLVAEEL